MGPIDKTFACNVAPKNSKVIKKMFCADYVAAFVYHAFFTIGSVNLVGKEVRQEELDPVMIMIIRAKKRG